MDESATAAAGIGTPPTSTTTPRTEPVSAAKAGEAASASTMIKDTIDAFLILIIFSMRAETPYPAAAFAVLAAAGTNAIGARFAHERRIEELI